MTQADDNFDEEEDEVPVPKCSVCGGSGLEVEGWDCEFCNGTGELEI